MQIETTQIFLAKSVESACINKIYGLNVSSHVIIFKKSLCSHRPVARPYELQENEIFL